MLVTGLKLLMERGVLLPGLLRLMGVKCACICIHVVNRGEVCLYLEPCA